MAVAVPLIMGAMGVSNTIIAITSIAFSVTGINDKINKAASKVFGEDLVQIGNLFGAAFGAVQSMGGVEGAFGGATNASSVDAVNGLDSMSDAFSATGSTGAGGFGSVADATSSVAAAGDFGSAVPYGNEADLAAQAEGFAEMGGDAGEFLGSASGGEQASNVIDLLNDPNAPARVSVENTALTSNVPTTGAAAPEAAGQGATSTQAAGSSATARVQGPATATPTQQRSFFDRLLFDERGIINPTTMRMGGQILGGYAQSREARSAWERDTAEQRRRMNQSTGLRVTR
jgi:hypothetical protein